MYIYSISEHFIWCSLHVELLGSRSTSFPGANHPRTKVGMEFTPGTHSPLAPERGPTTAKQLCQP